MSEGQVRETRTGRVPHPQRGGREDRIANGRPASPVFLPRLRSHLLMPSRRPDCHTSDNGFEPWRRIAARRGENYNRGSIGASGLFACGLGQARTTLKPHMARQEIVAGSLLLPRAALVAVFCGLLATAGCEKPNEGPKRADDKAAHSPRYHPDVARSTVTGSRPAPADDRPPATQFADLFRTGVVGSPVLFVNNQTITIPEVLEPIIEGLQRKARILPERDYTNEVLISLREQIDYRISTILVYEEAKRKYEDKRIQEAIDKRVEEMITDVVNERFGGVRARYEAHLKQLDYTPEEMKERLKRESIVREYLRERFRPMLREPSRRDLLRYYEEHAADFTTPDKAELFTIEIPLSTELKKPLRSATPAELEAARQHARQSIARAREEIESGVDFATVARAYSKGTMASQGGAWGEVTRGALTKRWARPGEVLFTLEPGRMAVVDTDEAIFLVRCGKKNPARRISFEDAQKQIIDKLIEDQFNQLRNEYIVDLIRRATISKRPEFTQALLAVVPRPSHQGSAGAMVGPGG